MSTFTGTVVRGESVARALFAALAAGTVSAEGALLLGARVSAFRFRELPASHVVVACLVANVAGAFFLRAIATRVRRPRAVYALVAFGLAAAATIEVALTHSEPGLLPITAGLHVAVAAISSIALPWFLAAEHGSEEVAASRPGGGLLLLVAAATGPVGLLADMNVSHVYSPLWPAHARFHGVLFALAMATIGEVCWALLLRPSPRAEHAVRMQVAAVLPVALWCSFFVACLVPGVSMWPDGFVHRAPVNGNLVLAGVVVALGLLGAWRSHCAPRAAARNAEGGKSG